MSDIQVSQNNSIALDQLEWRVPTATDLETYHRAELGLVGISTAGHCAVVQLAALEKLITRMETAETALKAKADEKCGLCVMIMGRWPRASAADDIFCDDSHHVKSAWKCCQMKHEKYSLCYFHHLEQHSLVFSESWQDCLECGESGPSGEYEFDDEESRVTDEQVEQYKAERHIWDAKMKARKEEKKAAEAKRLAEALEQYKQQQPIATSSTTKHKRRRR